MEPSMFGGYVLARSGTWVYIDRASFLMDPDLWQETLDALPEVDLYPVTNAQWAWDYYCRRHIEKHKEPFRPDIIPHWNQPMPPPLEEGAAPNEVDGSDYLSPVGPTRPIDKLLMFHTLVVTQCKTVIEIDRATPLMDLDLWRETLDALRKLDPRPITPSQWAWDQYCERHIEKYDEPFVPDVISGWPSPKTGESMDVLAHYPVIEPDPSRPPAKLVVTPVPPHLWTEYVLSGKDFEEFMRDRKP
jgi:hypothetical protein